MATKTKRAAIYLRVSTDGQATDKNGLPWRLWQRNAGGRSRRFEDAGISGAKGRDKRPGA